MPQIWLSHMGNKIIQSKDSIAEESQPAKAEAQLLRIFTTHFTDEESVTWEIVQLSQSQKVRNLLYANQFPPLPSNTITWNLILYVAVFTHTHKKGVGGGEFVSVAKSTDSSFLWDHSQTRVFMILLYTSLP